MNVVWQHHTDKVVSRSIAVPHYAAMEVLDRFEGGTILHTTLQPEITARLSEAVED